MDMMTRIAELTAETIKTLWPDAEGLPEAGELRGLLAVPPDPALGDYAFPCFRLAKPLRSAPPKIAEALCGAWQHGDVASVQPVMTSSAAVVRRFLEFNGVGVKIATMAANILACQCKIPFSDMCSIDVSPDVHVRRVMHRMGLVEKGAGIDEIIYKARELCPEFPGVIDFSLWRLGREICKADRPDCEHCPVALACKHQLG